MPGRAGRPHLAHVPALDGIRGLAVAAVLAYHLNRLRGGYLGVDAFFVLSGFLITSLLLAEWTASGAGTIELRRFWARRARRLLPALFVVLLAVAAYAAAWSGAAARGQIRGDGLATLFYVANWHAILAGHGYWALFSARSPLEHTWSLAIEEQFYVLWPLVVLGALRWRKGSLRSLLGLVLGLAALSAGAMALLYHPGVDPSRVYYGTDTRAAAILLGAALAIVLRLRAPADATGRTRSRAGLEVLAFGATAGLGWAWATVGGTSGGLYRGGFVLCGLAVVAVIASATHPRRGPVGVLLSAAPLRWLGRISYGLYLWHWPLYLALSPSRTHLSGLELDAVRVSVTLAVAIVSYHLVEMPIRRGALAGWRVRALAPASVAAVLAGLLVATTGAEPALSLASSSEGRRASSSPAPPPPTGAVRILVVGDSVALTVARGMDEVGAEEGIAVLNRGLLGCGVARASGAVRLGSGQVVTETAECHAAPARWAGDLQTFRPDVSMLLVGAWDAADRQLNGRWTHPCQSTFDRWYDGEISAAVQLLSSASAPVVLVTAPYLRSDVVSASQAETDRRIDCLNAVFRKAGAHNPRVRLVDLASRVCPSHACLTREDGVTLRPDGVHYDGPGGPVIARWLVPRVLDAAGVSRRGWPSPRHPIDAADPLRVLIIGDSVMYDATPGIGAALTSTGVVTLQAEPYLGMGLTKVDLYQWRSAWPRLVDALDPDIVVVLVGAWDISPPSRLDAPGWRAGYDATLDDAVRALTARGARVLWLGMPWVRVPGLSPAVLRLDDAFHALPSRWPQVSYVDAAAVLAGPDGYYTDALAGSDGALVRIRKPDGIHLCPEGAARLGAAVGAAVAAGWGVSPGVGWAQGSWRADARYTSQPTNSCAQALG